MGSFDDLFRNQRLYSDLLREQRLLPSSLELTKTMAAHWNAEPMRLSTPTLLGRDGFEASQRRNTELFGGLVSSMAVLETANATIQRGLGADLLREAARWSEVRQSVMRSSLLPRRSALTDASYSDWQRQIGTVASSLERALRESRALLPPVGFAESLAAPAFAYSEFSRRTIRRLPRVGTAVVPALEASLALADHQAMVASGIAAALIGARSSSGLLDADGAVDDTLSDTVDGGVRDVEGVAALAVDDGVLQAKAKAITLFRAEQRELVVAGVEAGVDSATVVDASLSARVALSAQRLLQTIVAIEAAWQFGSETPIFTRTLAVLEAAVFLSVHRVHDRRSLGDAVDALYVLIYEASGSMARVRAVLDDNRCDPVWQLKRLRNKWLRHDPEHGDVKKSLAELQEALGYFGMTRKPYTVREFTQLYEAILERMNEFANALLDAVIAPQV